MAMTGRLARTSLAYTKSPTPVVPPSAIKTAETLRAHGHTNHYHFCILSQHQTSPSVPQTCTTIGVIFNVVSLQRFLNSYVIYRHYCNL